MFKYTLISSLIIILFSCRDNKNGETLNSQINDVKTTDHVFKDENGWIIMKEISVKDFLIELKITEEGENKLNIISTIGEAPENWLKLDDLEFLISKIESKEKAKCIMRVISSHIPIYENITIGDQVISIIESYRKNERYPNGLTICEKYNVKKIKEIRDWWLKKKTPKHQSMLIKSLNSSLNSSF